MHVYRSFWAYLFNRDELENDGVFVVNCRALVSVAPKGHRPRPGMQSTYLGGTGPPPAPDENVVMLTRRDGRLERKVMVTRGAWKGNPGVIKDVTGNQARVELHTNSKVVSVSLDHLREMT